VGGMLRWLEEMGVPGKRKVGRPRKTGSSIVMQDLDDFKG